MGNPTDAFKIITCPAVAVRGPKWGYWLVLALLTSILVACASNIPQTVEVEEQESAAPSEIPTTQAISTETGPGDRPLTDDSPRQFTIQPSQGRATSVAFPPAQRAPGDRQR